MYSKQIIRSLNTRPDHISQEQKNALDENGFYAVENVLTPEECATMAQAFEDIIASEKDQGGHEVHIEPGARRISNIFNKSDAFDKCLEIPEVLAASNYLLGEFKVHGANLRDPNKGFGHQDYHTDVHKKFADDWWVLNAVVAFDDITLENGPTRVVPGSHKWVPINVPVVNQGDWEPDDVPADLKSDVPEDLSAAHPQEIFVTAKAGSVVLMNSSLWHSGTLKHSDAPRRVLHLTYTRRDLPQQLTQIDYLTPELYERMSPEHRYLLEIEAQDNSGQILRQPKREQAGWWN
ncbi:phytanoyl-CoA dioxygenase family protein [Pararhizobium sp. IMCC21322]|uniref:phytanoyl-CoA dioxygenase family protein n=1 Tax=Pararhizobium sp. IMCC21322 TaxID=3067903 RepID=UPI0027404451|nr:phytanoyl-CoA dioxygenase family protein [Pararhizobium sp. IMCC21322]